MGEQLLSWRMKTLKRSGCPGRASAQLGRHFGPHNTVRIRGTGDPRVEFGGSRARGHGDAMTGRAPRTRSEVA